MDRPDRPWLARGVLAAVVLLLLVPTGISAVEHEKTALGPGTVERPADAPTYVSVQGFHFKGVGNPKKPARLVVADGNASARVLTDGREHGVFWFYDVDPQPNGTLLVTATNPDETVVFELDPQTNERLWTERLPIHDTHDVDKTGGGELLVANMRNNRNGTSRDRVFAYDRSTDEVTWEWVFADHYPRSTDGGYSADWTHVNDIDRVSAGRYLVSPRNFDQVLLLNRSTNEVEMRLGADGRHDVLYEQHNPDYLESPNGTPTILVADSENDRVVEYERRCGGADPRLGAGTPPSQCEWKRVWSVSGFNWPRDADRLPNGNTLVTDTLNHRVVEITPKGEVVWEVYAAWAPYDAERGAQGSNGPTMRAQGASGDYRVHGGAHRGPASQETFSDWLATAGEGTPVESQLTGFAERYRHVTPFLRPVWMSSWALASLFLAVAVVLAWAVGELVYQRRSIVRALRRLAESGRERLG